MTKQSGRIGRVEGVLPPPASPEAAEDALITIGNIGARGQNRRQLLRACSSVNHAGQLAGDSGEAQQPRGLDADLLVHDQIAVADEDGHANPSALIEPATSRTCAASLARIFRLGSRSSSRERSISRSAGSTSWRGGRAEVGGLAKRVVLSRRRRAALAAESTFRCAPFSRPTLPGSWRNALPGAPPALVSLNLIAAVVEGCVPADLTVSELVCAPRSLERTGKRTQDRRKSSFSVGPGLRL